MTFIFPEEKNIEYSIFYIEIMNIWLDYHVTEIVAYFLTEREVTDRILNALFQAGQANPPHLEVLHNTNFLLHFICPLSKNS